MNNLENFVKANHCEHAENLVSEDLLELAQEQIGLKFGSQLKEYLLKYGYLGYQWVELYGMNYDQELDTDLLEQTLYLHKYFALSKSLIALEFLGDNRYALVDSNDSVYICDFNRNSIENQNMKLFDYILKRFENAIKR